MSYNFWLIAKNNCSNNKKNVYIFNRLLFEMHLIVSFHSFLCINTNKYFTQEYKTTKYIGIIEQLTNFITNTKKTENVLQFIFCK